MSKSFKLAPGVRMTVSKSGIGYSAGAKGARITRTARGNVVTTVSIPGTGVSYSSSASTKPAGGPDPRNTQVVVEQPGQPSLTASRPEKELHKALIVNHDLAALEHIAAQYPEWAPLCAALDGLFAFQAGDRARAGRALHHAVSANIEFADHPFIRKYILSALVTLQVAEGVSLLMPFGREAAGLALAEILQADGRLPEAIGVVESLDPSFSAAISLAELYSDSNRHDDVIKLTNDLQNNTDSHAFLLVLRGRSLRELGLPDSAREALKEALRRRSVDPEIRKRAYLERANTFLQQGKKGLAKKDLERIFAEDSDYPGLRQALDAVDADIRAATRPS